MRVACFSCTYPPYAGGIGNVAARHARMLLDAGHEVAVGTPAFHDAVGCLVIDGITVHRLPTLVRHGNSALVRGVRRLVDNADAVYLHYPFYGGAEHVARACAATGTPYVVFFHMDVHRGGIAGALIRAHQRLVQPGILRRARAVLVSSADYASTSSLRDTPLPLLVESPYTAPERFAPGPPDASALRRMGLDADRPLFLFVGAMDADHGFKGIAELLRAFAAVRRHVLRPQLALAGAGNRRDEYMAMASELGDDAIVFPGRVSDDDLLSLYRAARATVLPSTNSDEAYGVVLAEGMACGSPGIASALPGVRTVIDDGLTGVLVPPGDVPALSAAMRRLLDDGTARDMMSRAALADRDARLAPRHERDTLVHALGLA